MRRLTPNDFLWSIRLGSQLRILSYENDFEYIFAKLDEPGYKTYRKIIPCKAGHCILCKPDIGGKAVFWEVEISQIEEQIKSGALILNSIPQNWYDLKSK